MRRAYERDLKDTTLKAEPVMLKAPETYILAVALSDNPAGAAKGDTKQ